MENNYSTEVTAPDVETTDEKIERLIALLEPVAAFVENDLPELKEKIGPMMDAFANSPVAKMLGIRVP